MLKNHKIKYVSLDDGHQFGLPKPFNLREALIEDLNGKSLQEVIIKENTSDLLLKFNNDLEIEVFISSGGYESYSLVIEENQYIGMGGGEIAIFPA